MKVNKYKSHSIIVVSYDFPFEFFHQTQLCMDILKENLCINSVSISLLKLTRVF